MDTLTANSSTDIKFVAGFPIAKPIITVSNSNKKNKVTKEWTSTDYYEGTLIDNLPYKGRGFYSYDNGDYFFHGEWTWGKYHTGYGKKTAFTDENVTCFYEGGWKNGVFSGYQFALYNTSVTAMKIIDDKVVLQIFDISQEALIIIRLDITQNYYYNPTYRAF